MADPNAKPDDKGAVVPERTVTAEAMDVDAAKDSEVAKLPGLQDVFNALKKATEVGPEAEAELLVIENVEIPDPAAAFKNLEEALKLLPTCVKPNLNDTYFKSFPGQKVGESTAEGAKIDPIMLLHPARRLAHVIAHETAHKKNTVPNEGLVEVYLRAIGLVEDGEDGPKTTVKYDKALAGFSEFLKKMSKGENSKNIAVEVYNLYYKGEYGKIYEMYNKMHVEKLSPAEQDEEVKFFWEVFPELEYDKKAQTQHKPFPQFVNPKFAPKV
ncbi:MAG: hypothetical protein Q8P62_05075 [Candidatus Peregrinibacteria bacterium]|nr:hypothetical protein [Candidatus Peregrinibacteria bacterium]